MINCNESTWVDDELNDCKFKDGRIKNRCRTLLEDFWHAVGKPIPLACHDWSNTKAAYRFLSNSRISEDEIMQGHFSATRQRFNNTKGSILLLQDTTEFSYQREDIAAVGITKLFNSGKDKYGRNRLHTICGILMHTSLAVTTDGLPLGISAIKFWTRDKFKGTNSLKKKLILLVFLLIKKKV